MAYIRVADYDAENEPTAYDAIVFKRDDGTTIHFIIADTTPQGVTTFDDAPIGSILMLTTDGTMFYKQTSTTWAMSTDGTPS